MYCVYFVPGCGAWKSGKVRKKSYQKISLKLALKNDFSGLLFKMYLLME
jgi:hypothetical protein